jgi:hypothetical protein
VIYLILGAGFLLSGLSLIRTMREHFPSFYLKTKKQIWAATIILSVTCWVRAILDIIRWVDSSGLDKAIDDSVLNNTWLAPTYDSGLFLLSDLIPIFAQLLSLIFGLMRKR